MDHANSSWLRSALRSSEFRVVAVIVLFLTALTVGGYQVLCAYASLNQREFPIEFLKGVHVETVGLLFDTVLFGFLIYIIRHRDNSERTRNDTIGRNLEILDDFRTWGSEEATFRITGALRRLTEYKTSLDLAGLCLTNVSLVERGIRDVSGSSFSAMGRETKLRAISFKDVACRSVRFSEYTPNMDVASAIGNRRELIAGLRRQKKFPEELIQRIEEILKDNDALDNAPSDRTANFAKSLAPNDAYTFPDDREAVKRALEVLARLSESVCFEGVDLSFETSKLDDARFEGARLIWTSTCSPFAGAEARKLSFKNATIINADFGGFLSLEGLNLDGAWFYPRFPRIGAAYGNVSPDVHAAMSLGLISAEGITNIDKHLRPED